MSVSTNYSLSQGIEELVDMYMVEKEEPLENYETQKKEAQNVVNVYTDLKSKLTELRTEAKTFLEVGEDAVLSSKAIESSDESVITASVDSNAEEGVLQIKVNHLADRDYVISNKFSNGTSKTIAEMYNGKTETFEIGLGDGELVEISIDFKDKTETNESVLNRIASAIRDSGLDISSYTLKDSASSVRLTISSEESGSENKIVFGKGSDLLVDLGIMKNKGSTERKLASGDEGGYLKADEADLDAEFTFNGITITRGSNEVDDLIEGVSFTLRAVQEESDAPVSLTITRNEETITEQIQTFIDTYNSAITYLNDKSAVDTTTYTRGALTGNSTYLQLKINLRTIIASDVDGIESGQLMNLRELGIEINSDGTLEIEDMDALEDAIENNGDEVEAMFNSENGLAKQFDSVLEKYVQTGGIIDDSKKAINRKIDAIEDRIEAFEKRLEVERETLRNKFIELQKALSSLSSQQSIIDQSTSILSLYESSYY